MIISLIAYGFITLLMVLLGRNLAIRERITLNTGGKVRFLNAEMVLILLLFSVFSGIRYGVGTDYFSYLFHYNRYAESGIQPGWFGNGEYLFEYLTSFFATINLPASFFFGTIAFIQIICVYYLLRKHQYLYIFIPFILFWNHFYLDWMNGIRQCIAVCIFTASIGYAIERKYLKYAIAIGVCTLFHKSALPLLAVILLPDRDLFKNRLITTGIVLAALAIGQTSFIGDYFDQILGTAQLFGYERYEYRLTEITAGNVEALAFGPRNIAFLLNYLMIIYFSVEMKKFHRNDKLFTWSYNLTIINAILFFLSMNISHIFIRLAMYFENFNLITSAFLLHYLWYSYRHTPRKSYYLTMFSLFAFINMIYLVVATYFAPHQLSYDVLFNH
ncbi:EpsG family protein [Alistipes sp.]|uniref:EpsG family protein n=1 Tax=Alistipes sp. TaxID=1872444 RepID=UPI003AF0B280